MSSRRKAIIAELEGYFAGERMFPIDLAIEAIAVLSKKRASTGKSKSLILRLQKWLGDDNPRMPDTLARELLVELRDRQP